MFNQEVTSRSFQVLKFVDRYDVNCSIQESSINGGGLWIGVDSPNPRILTSEAAEHGLQPANLELTGWQSYPIPEAVSVTTRMHLDHDQIRSIIVVLQQWVDNNSNDEQ